MADFVPIKENGVPIWINLDYVIRINRGLDPQEPTSISFTDGKEIVISRSEGDGLVLQLNRCCRSAAQGGSKKKPGGSGAPKITGRRKGPGRSGR